MLKILVADDHALMREGIQTVLARFDGDLCLVDASNYEDVFRHLASATDFDLVLLDLTMPGEDPFPGLKRVLATAKETPVIVLSASEDPDDIHHSIELGARGFIPKSVSNEVLVAALELVLSGGVYLPPQLFDYTNSVEYTVGIPANNGTVSRAPNAVPPTITKRQKEVLELLALGNPNKAIGHILGLSEGTVRTHVNAIFKLLNVNNRTQAGVCARELGLLGDSS